MRLPSPGGKRSCALGIGLALAGLRCAPTDVVVAAVPGHRDGGEPRKCGGDEDCDADDFCARNMCDDTAGQCEHRPVFCDAGRAPTCGCDGITYWNDCLRRLSGVTAGTPGECAVNAAACTPGSCPHGASCARIFPDRDRCPSDGAGACWMLPPQCPPPDGPRFNRCSDPKSCVSACEAIRSEQPHRPLSLMTCGP
jgi:hypothetical protein